MARNLTGGEKRFAAVLTDWERNEITGVREARARGLKLLARLREAGLAVVYARPPRRKNPWLNAKAKRRKPESSASAASTTS